MKLRRFDTSGGETTQVLLKAGKVYILSLVLQIDAFSGHSHYNTIAFKVFNIPAKKYDSLRFLWLLSARFMYA